MSHHGDKFITLFSDASHCPNTGATGWSGWIKFGSPAVTLKPSGVAMNVKGSNDAEIMGLNGTLDYLLERNVPLEGRILVVQCDCQGAMDMVAPRLNAIKRQYGMEAARFKWVKGHRGTACPRSSVNTTCDIEAKRLMRELRDSLLNREQA